jgi:predicted DNA-binding transcriptional regulator AlpA
VPSDSHHTMLAAGERQHRQKFGAPADVLSRLPPSVTDNRILKTDEAAALAGYSVAHWREMYRDGRVPTPIRLSARRYGWKVSTILAWLDEKAAA